MVVWMITAGLGCKQTPEKPDSYYQGSILISCDESFKPVIDQQIQVYEAEFPGAKIRVRYKPEADCLRDLAVDSVRMVITTRGISANERNFIIDSLQTDPRQLVI